jgi:hypothetical protein
LVASILVDVEPFLVLSLGLDFPLHGFLHTFVVAFILGLVLGYAMFLLERISRSLYKTLLLESDATPKLRSFIVAGVLGTMLHVLLDSPLYDDIHPFYPLSANPLLHSASSSEVYSFCVWMGILGIAFYLGLLIFSVYRGLEKKWQRTRAHNPLFSIWHLTTGLLGFWEFGLYSIILLLVLFSRIKRGFE